MRIIGIVPGAKLFGSEDLYADQYLFVNGYPKRILANGGTPVGILSSDGYAAEDSLSLCDAFVFCGGARFYPYHFQVMEYAAKSGKPVLGICLGEQILGRRSEETGGVDLLGPTHGLPELLAGAAVVGLHLWKRQMLLSIVGGTICYMLLVQFVF